MTGVLTKMTIEKIKNLFKGIVAFIIVTMSLFHIFFNSSPPKLAQNNKDYKEIIKNRNLLQAKYLEELNQKKITSDKYYLEITKLLSESKKEIKKVNNEKRAINNEFSFRGRRSFHFWIFVFGLVLPLLFFSCKSLYQDILRGDKYKSQFLSLTGIVVSFFWMIHLIFFTQKDFSKNSYILIILVCAIFCTFFTYFLIKQKINILIKKVERGEKSDEFERLSFEFIKEVNKSILKGA